MLADALQRWRNETEADHVRWVEVFASSLRLNSTPLSVAEVFRKQLAGHPKAWIFTSATLSVRQDFSHYQQQMGLEDAVTCSWDSPFDYQNQSLLFVPEEMPDPNSGSFTEAVVSTSLPRRLPTALRMIASAVSRLVLGVLRTWNR